MTSDVSKRHEKGFTTLQHVMGSSKCRGECALIVMSSLIHVIKFVWLVCFVLLSNAVAHFSLGKSLSIVTGMYVYVCVFALGLGDIKKSVIMIFALMIPRYD